jgi:hypothetical protein
MCTPGEPIIYEFELTNTGKEPLWLPWSMFPDRVRGDAELPPGYRELAVSLKMDAANGAGSVLGDDAIAAGSEEAEGSLRSVAAGEVVRMRAPATCPSRTAGKRDDRSPQHAAVYVQLSLRPGTGTSPAAAQSSKYELTVMPH